MSNLPLKDWISIFGFVLSLPTIAFALYSLVRFWRAKIRKEGSELASLEKEKAYLAALQEYLEELNRPLGYSDKEYTAPEGVLIEQEHIELRYVFRNALPYDQRGLNSRDILTTERGTLVHNIDSLLRKARKPIVLLGEPGSGKSVTLRHLALGIARQQSDGRRIWPALPVYVHLGSYSQNDDKGQAIELLEFIKYQLGHVIPGGSNILEVLEDALKQGRIYLLLDAMDEMPSKDFASRADRIKQFLIEYGKLNSIVIACRNREYSGTFPHSELIVEPFNAKRVHEYLEKHWELYAKRILNPDTQQTAHSSYLALAEPDHPLFTFATNPFSLKLLANYFFANAGTLPRIHAEVFESYIEKKLEVESNRRKWREAKQETVLNIWKEIAYGTLESNLGTYLSSSEIAKLERLKARTSNEINEALDVAICSGLMRREVDDSVRFEHHRLLEYLAASYWEQISRNSDLTVDHLNNPWWRETIILRGGITRNPNVLIQLICRAIDRRYLLLLGLRYPDEPEPADFPSDTATIRLEGILAIEVALDCVRQRIGELYKRTFEFIEPLTLAVARRGSLIEQVRLARTLKGMPLAYSHHLLAEMVASRSDWLVNEVFNAIDRKDYKDPKFATILNKFLRETSPDDIFRRLRSVKNLSLLSCWRLAQSDIKLSLMRTGLIFLGYWLIVLGVFGILVPYYMNLGNEELLTPKQLSNSSGQWSAVISISFLLATSLFWNGARLTVYFILFSVVCYLLVPPRTAFRLILCFWIYTIGIGENFKRAKWLSNPVVRLVTLGNCLPRWYRILVTFLLFNTLTIYWIYLVYGEATEFWMRTSGGFAGVLLIELLLEFRNRLTVRSLLERSVTMLEPKELEWFLSESLKRLRNPLPPRFARQILNRIVEIPIEEHITIERLKAFADRDEFFIPRDEILEAIDRIDLRRRQKVLEVAPIRD
ncbi:NACHT domain-containing protein [Methylomonas sp. MgM2]